MICLLKGRDIVLTGHPCLAPFVVSRLSRSAPVGNTQFTVGKKNHSRLLRGLLGRIPIRQWFPANLKTRPKSNSRFKTGIVRSKYLSSRGCSTHSLALPAPYRFPLINNLTIFNNLIFREQSGSQTGMIWNNIQQRSDRKLRIVYLSPARYKSMFL